MNESNDLKNRILQMRQDNNIDTTEVHNKDSNNDKDSKKDSVIENKVENIIKNNDPKNNTNIKKSNEDEAFKMLASKFNQSVEVILELTKRVEKLETLVRLQTMQSENTKTNKNKKFSGKNNNNKLFFLVMFVLGIVYLFYFFKIDLNILEEIILEFSNILRK